MDRLVACRWLLVGDNSVPLSLPTSVLEGRDGHVYIEVTMCVCVCVCVCVHAYTHTHEHSATSRSS